MHNTCSKVDAQAAFSLNVRNMFIQSKLHTYQKHRKPKKRTLACVYVIKKNAIKIHIPRQDGGFSESIQVSLANFIVPKPTTYNLEMSLYF